MSLWRYLRCQAVALDQALNALLGGAPDETLSSRLGRGKAKGDDFSADVCAVLDVLEEQHCEKSIEYLPDGTPNPHDLPRVER